MIPKWINNNKNKFFCARLNSMFINLRLVFQDQMHQNSPKWIMAWSARWPWASHWNSYLRTQELRSRIQLWVPLLPKIVQLSAAVWVGWVEWKSLSTPHSLPHEATFRMVEAEWSQTVDVFDSLLLMLYLRFKSHQTFKICIPKPCEAWLVW